MVGWVRGEARDVNRQLIINEKGDGGKWRIIVVSRLSPHYGTFILSCWVIFTLADELGTK